LNYRHIEVFFAVMTCGTVTEAARQLGVSQPSVTTTLQQAEARLGLTLFQRESGRLIPTAEAKTLYEEASRAHEALASFKTLAKRLQLGHGGHVRVASIPSISMELLPDAIGLFHQKHPGFNFSVSTLNTEDILAQLNTGGGAFDLGFTFGNLDGEYVASQRLGETELLAVFPAGWDIPAGKEIDLADLKEMAHVAGFAGTALTKACQTLFLEAGFEPQIAARIHTHHLAGRLVQRRLGYTILDSVTVRALLHERLGNMLVIRRIKGNPSLPVISIFSSHKGLSNAARLFTECFCEAYRKIDESVEKWLP